MRKISIEDLIDHRVIIDFASFEEKCLLLIERADAQSDSYLREVLLYEKGRLKVIPFDERLIGVGFDKGVPYVVCLKDKETALFSLSGVCEVVLPFQAKNVIKHGNMIYALEVADYSPFQGSVVPARLEGGVEATGVHCHLWDRSEKRTRFRSPPEEWVEKLVVDRNTGEALYSALSTSPQRTVGHKLYLVNPMTRQRKQLIGDRYRLGSFQKREGTVFFQGVDLNIRTRNDNKRLYRLDVQTGAIDPFGPAAGYSDERPSVTTDVRYGQGETMHLSGSDLYIILNGPNGSKIHRIDPQGNREILDPGLHTIDHMRVEKGKILLIGLRDLDRQELFSHDKKTQRLEQLTVLNRWERSPQLQRPQFQVCRSPEGHTIEGWVLPPLESKKERSPGILVIHGGPKMRYTPCLSVDLQLLSAAGYYVLYANPRGSDGREEPFDQIRGHYADRAMEDLLHFTDHVLGTYTDLDPDRVGVMGGSYGGYMTNVLITETHRFRAAVSERSISHMRTAYGTSDIGHQYAKDYLGGVDPWEAPDLYDALSPLLKSDRVQTPVLFIHGEKDQRCSYTESLQFFTELRARGAVARLKIFEGETHGLPVSGRPSAKRGRMREILEWFDRYLMEG